jgi:SAM-dependent methyltransferase
MSAPKKFDKYWYYEKSVQNPSNEVEFFAEKYEELMGRKAYSLREDFCGTGAISCKWVEQGEKFEAWGVDLDPEPLAYGKKHHYAKLDKASQKRMHYLQANVLNAKAPKVDICFAYNFSYYIFKKRSQLLQYFKAAYQSIKKDGVFFIDLFGGPDSIILTTDEVNHGSFKYYWDCQKFDPLTNNCQFAIHFKLKGEKKRENVFVYDWRMWGMMELRDLLIEAGFAKTLTYWEGEDGEGSGNGIFQVTEEATQCESWVTYIAALK